MINKNLCQILFIPNLFTTIGYAQIPSSCSGYPNGTKIFYIAVQNECNEYLNGYPVSVKGAYGGVAPSWNFDVSYKENSTTTLGSICSPNTYKFAIAFAPYGATFQQYLVRPGVAINWYEPPYYPVPICCTYDSLPTASGVSGLYYGSFTPYNNTTYPSSTNPAGKGEWLYSGSGTFSPIPSQTFTVNNPVMPLFKIENLNVDMNHTEKLFQCNSNYKFTMQNLTNTYGSTVQYLLKIYSSDATRAIISLIYNSGWTTPSALWGLGGGATLDLSTLINATPAGQYYVVELSVKSNCISNPANPAMWRGHIQTNLYAGAETSDFQFLPTNFDPIGDPYPRTTSLTDPLNPIPYIGATTGGITGIYANASKIDYYNIKIEEVNETTGTSLSPAKFLLDKNVTTINGSLPKIRGFAIFAMDGDGIGIGATTTQTNFFYNNYSTCKSKTYKCTITTYNNCNTTPVPVWSYFKLSQNTSYCPNCRTATKQEINTKNEVTNLGLQVYPNPVNEQANLVLQSPIADIAELTIVDITGKVVFAKNYEVEEGSNMIIIPTLNWANGTYVFNMTLSSNNNILTGKIIKI